jgi:hypothetical protein
MALLLSSSWIISYPRLVLVIFPIYIIVANMSRKEEVGALLSATTALCMGDCSPFLPQADGVFDVVGVHPKRFCIQE